MGELISEDYRGLNADLHARHRDYGARGFLWRDRVATILAEEAPRSILDYGCGKGSLKAALWPGFNVHEYDPAIPGKDAEPAPAELVVCTDVLEHIEPDRLEAVLEHLQKVTKAKLLFSICTVPAQKTLRDGRNTHLSLHDAVWWKVALDRWFALDEGCATTPTHFSGTARPKVYQIEAFNTLPAIAEDERIEHVRQNVRKTKKRLAVTFAHDQRATLVCFGPSLKRTWSEVVAEQALGHHVISVSGAHAFLVDRGIIPYAHVDCDPRPHKTALMGRPHAGVAYWPASCVHPSYLDRLVGFDVSLWHLWNGDASAPVLDEVEPGAWALAGGGSAGLRALALLYALGYRWIDIHGMDCSQGETTHAAPHSGKPQATIDLRCGDRWFKTTGALASYAQQFFDFKRRLPDVTCRLHGDGLLQHICRISAASERDSNGQ